MLLPAYADARQFLGPNAMSYSEISTLAACEKKWSLIYDAEREDYAPSDAMALGSEMHRRLGDWWNGNDYQSEHLTVQWLMDRYHQHYGHDQIEPLHMEALEVPFAVRCGGMWIFGWMDGLVRNIDTKELWIAEFKTMGNWQKLNQLPVDKQITLYIWAARAMGYPVKGVMFDAIRTYRWTGKNADDHEPAESFRREWVERTDEQIQDCLLELESARAIRTELTWRNRVPLRNVGQSCDWCSVQPQCFGIDLTLLAG